MPEGLFAEVDVFAGDDLPDGVVIVVTRSLGFSNV